MRHHNPQAQALTEEAARREVDEAVASHLHILGRHDTPHVYRTQDGTVFVTARGQRASVDVSMSLTQLRSLHAQAALILGAAELRDAS